MSASQKRAPIPNILLAQSVRAGVGPNWIKQITIILLLAALPTLASFALAQGTGGIVSSVGSVGSSGSGSFVTNPSHGPGFGNGSIGNIPAEQKSSGVGFDQAVYSVWRNTGEACLTLVRGSETDLSPLSVAYETWNLSASDGRDFYGGSGIVQFAANETAKALRVPILPTDSFGVRKTFAVLLTGPRASTSLGASSAAVVEILDLRAPTGILVRVAPPVSSNLAMTRPGNGEHRISWSSSGQLQHADRLDGHWRTLPLAKSPTLLKATAPAGFYRVAEPRPASVFVPSAHNAAGPLPLVILLHAYSTTATTYQEYMRLAPIAERRGFLYCFPEGTADELGYQFWNATDACCDVFGANPDDTGYLRELINAIGGRFSVDEKRIYLVGHSNGGFMAFRMACEHADLIAGIVSLQGATFLNPQHCAPSGPVNILHIHGTADGVIPYDGGHLGMAQSFPVELPSFPAAFDSIRLWAAYNRCTDPTVDTQPTLDLDLSVPGLDTTALRYTHCPSGGAVEFWTIGGGGHGPAFFDGDTASQFSEKIVEWLLAHPKP
jgi:poly(3-hydroxybutyrate) depolymerase